MVVKEEAKPPVAQSPAAKPKGKGAAEEVAQSPAAKADPDISIKSSMKSSSAKSSAKKSKKKIPKKLIGVKQLPKYNKELKNMDSYVEGGGRVFAPKDKDNHTHTLVYLHHLTGKPQDY